MGQQGAAHADAGGADCIHGATHHHRFGDDGTQALAEGGGQAQADADDEMAAHLFPFTLLRIATAA